MILILGLSLKCYLFHHIGEDIEEFTHNHQPQYLNVKPNVHANSIQWMYATLLVGSSQCSVSPSPKLYWSFQNCRGTVPELVNFDFNILPCSFYSVYPTMQLLLLSTLFILATALAHRDPGFCINCPSKAVVCYHKDSFAISRALSPSLERISSLFLSASKAMRLPPRVKLNLGLSLLLLLAGDVNLNPGPVTPNLCLGAVSARSMRDKVPALSALVVSKGIDLLGITETWLTIREISSDLAEMTPHGFSFFQTPRVNKRGGGVGLFVSKAFKFTPINQPSQSSFECISGKFECGRACLNILNIHRPPGPASSSFSELQDLLLYIDSLPHDLVLIGDFNLHLESSSSGVRQLTGILESFDLNQHVNFPTHIHGHSLDVMIFSKGCDVLSVSPSDAISDNFSFITDLWIPTDHSHTVPQTITYRKLKLINMEAFKADIKNSDLIKNPKSNATELAQQYDNVLSTLIDFHAPLATKKIYPKPPNPWMTPAILASKRHSRYLERVWHRYPTALNRSRLSKQIHLCNRQMSKIRSLFQNYCWALWWSSVFMANI